jgi:hypothetical protein
MLLRIVVCLAMVAFAIWQGVAVASIPSPEGRHYFPIIYIAVAVLLLAGVGPRGILTWPLATILLLIRGHWVVGWIPLVLVLFNLIGNELLKARATQRKEE